MKVLYLANHLNKGGISSYLLNLAHIFYRRDDIEMVVASRGGDCLDELRRLGVRHYHLPLMTKCEVSPKVFWSFLKLLVVFRREPFDLYHANTRVTQILAALLSWATGKPYISTCHGYFKNRLFRRILPCWGKRVVAISDEVRRHLQEEFNVARGRIRLVYNGVDCKKFCFSSSDERRRAREELGIGPSQKLIGHIGRLSDVKGQKYLVSAAERILGVRGDVRFVIVGDGKEKGALCRQIKERNLGREIRVLPSVENTASVLSAFDVFAMPSLEEGLGISILEAQAKGVPVVASRVGGILTVVEDGQTGLLFAPKDVRALAAGILRLLNDQDLRERVVFSAQQQVRDKFSAQKMAQDLLQVYGEVA